MSLSVSAPVLWDEYGNFQNNALVGVQADAIVVGIKQKPTSPADPTLVNTLQVKDRRFGTLYLSWTLAQWQAAANITFTSPTTEQTYTTTITGGSTDTISSPLLANSVIDGVFINGTVANLLNVAYTSVGGIGTIVLEEEVGPGSVVQILYHNA